MASAYRGEDVASLLGEIERLVGSGTDMGMLSNLHNSRAVAALTAGDLVAAYAEFHRAAVNDPADTDAASDAAHAALWRGDMATLLDPAEPEVLAAADPAREILIRLRARPFLARLESAMQRDMPQVRREPSTPPSAERVPTADR